MKARAETASLRVIPSSHGTHAATHRSASSASDRRVVSRSTPAWTSATPSHQARWPLDSKSCSVSGSLARWAWAASSSSRAVGFVSMVISSINCRGARCAEEHSGRWPSAVHGATVAQRAAAAVAGQLGLLARQACSCAHGLVTEAAPGFFGVEAHDLPERAVAAEDPGEPPVTDVALRPQTASLHQARRHAGATWRLFAERSNNALGERDRPGVHMGHRGRSCVLSGFTAVAAASVAS